MKLSRFQLHAAILLSIAWFLFSTGAFFCKFLVVDEQEALSCPDCPDSSSKRRTLVIVLGSLRGGEAAWRSLQDNVLDVNDADLAVMTQEPIPARYQNSSLHRRAKYWWTVKTYDDWMDAMDLVNNSSDWREVMLNNYAGGKNIMMGGIMGVRASAAIVFMFRWFLAEKLKELELVDKYDVFIVTRSDHYYLCPQDLSHYDHNHLWVAEGEDYHGINDRHLMTGRDLILPALNIMPSFLANIENYVELLRKPTGNSERFLLLRWTEEGLAKYIRRTPRTMFAVMTPQDTSGWGSPQSFPPMLQAQEQIYYKYMFEYLQALANCWPVLDESSLT